MAMLRKLLRPNPKKRMTVLHRPEGAAPVDVVSEEVNVASVVTSVVVTSVVVTVVASVVVIVEGTVGDTEASVAVIVVVCVISSHTSCSRFLMMFQASVDVVAVVIIGVGMASADVVGGVVVEEIEEVSTCVFLFVVFNDLSFIGANPPATPA